MNLKNHTFSFHHFFPHRQFLGQYLEPLKQSLVENQIHCSFVHTASCKTYEENSERGMLYDVNRHSYEKSNNHICCNEQNITSTGIKKEFEHHFSHQLMERKKRTNGFNGVEIPSSGIFSQEKRREPSLTSGLNSWSLHPSEG
jgi:uncharacterized NAD(P)/FAD-binding protein YdhS